MLEIERLTKHYGALVGVQDLSFEVRPGEVVGLLGPNGSGKSTTVKILAGLLRPTRGVVRVDGADILTNLPSYKAALGYVPEEPHLYSYLTGPEYLQLVGRLRGIPDATLDGKIDRFLQLLGIYDDRYQTLASYSKHVPTPTRRRQPSSTSVFMSPALAARRSTFTGAER